MAQQATMWRPAFHFTAGYGWLNDPNGLLWDGRRYHLFYQHNPLGCEWSSMHWGHATSADLLHWQHLPRALEPDAPYDAHPSGGCFSGSAVMDGDTMALLYTGTVPDTQTPQTQNLATSMDGETFTKFSGNPLLTAPPEGLGSFDFRDPKVLRHNGSWYMVVATRTGQDDKTGDGRILLYQSQDLRDWRFLSVLFQSNGGYGSMIECPDLFPVEDKWALVFSPMYKPDHRQCVWLLGDMDFATGAFTPQKEGVVDYGFDFYAAQTYPDKDGRQQTIGWMNSQPWMTWFSGNGPTANEGWCGAMSLPRHCGLDSAGRLCWQPVEAVEALRGAPAEWNDVVLDTARFSLPAQPGNRYELCITADMARLGDGLHLNLFEGGGRALTLFVDTNESRLVLCRDNADGYTRGTTTAPLYAVDGKLRLRVIADRSTVEIFSGEGTVCISSNIYPAGGQSGLSLCAESSAGLESLRLYSLGGNT